jgi:hypothetical protein
MAALVGAAWALAAACTLSNEEYEPPLIAADPLMRPEPGEPDAGACDDRTQCCDGAQCCSAVACPNGEGCVDGACQAPDAPDAPDASLPSPPAECMGADCPGSMPPVPLAPSCDDGLMNGEETGTDCGGGCELACGAGVGCVSDADCADGFFCPEQTSRCSEVSCEDDVQNGGETSTDCGGGCPGCADGAACNTGSDCQSLVCDAGICAEPACNDEQRNGGETGTDCGGPCQQNCGTGGGCEANNDCQSGVCRAQGCAEGVERCCQAPSCNDDVRNGIESDVDCGGLGCSACGLGDSCVINLQCNTGFCQGGVCAIPPPRCDDNIENGTESDVDCGGSCAPCADQRDCNQDTDCANNNCDASGICISCGDTVRNGTETAVDCGGADLACRRCVAGEACLSNTDCVNQFCLGGFCT